MSAHSIPVPVPVLPGAVAAGWGRAAVSRFSKAPDDIRAEVIKALEGRISVEFKDYSQWQREPALQTEVTCPKRTSRRLIPNYQSTRPLTGHSGTSCASTCVHPWNNQRSHDDTTTQNTDNNKLQILQILIEAKEKSVQQYESLCEELVQQNRALKIEIDDISTSSHRNCTNLLEKYQEYASASKAIKRHHIERHHGARVNLNLTAIQLQKELEYLEQELIDIDRQLHNILQDVQILRTYKDKEYPIKEMQISRLTKKLDELYLQQKTEKRELEKVTMGEDLALRMKHNMRSREILESSASNAISPQISGALMQMATHNTFLQQEIEDHKQDILGVEESIRLLQLDVNILCQMPESDLRRTVFPGFLLPSKKCHPDEDLKLDIPMQKPPPI